MISNIWIIGDQFVNDYYHALPMMASQAKKVGTELPYLYQWYAINCFMTSPSTTNDSVPARFVNNIVKELNRTSKLPRFILIVPDWDLAEVL